MDRFVIAQKKVRTDENQSNKAADLPVVVEDEPSPIEIVETSDSEESNDEEPAAGAVPLPETDLEPPEASEERQRCDAAAATDKRDCPNSIEDLSQVPADGPRQPHLKSFPRRLFGAQGQQAARSFNYAWFKQYQWLEYSVSTDAVFCFACRHFFNHVHGPGQAQKSFTHDGFRNWKKGAEKLAKHNASASHRLAMEGWCEFKEREKSGSRILTHLDAGHDEVVKENRRYMQAVVEALRFTACQTIGQRGHRENEQSVNRGNFLELLHVLGKFDTTVSNRLSSGPGNAKYVHHDIQNEVIDTMASMVREQISNEVKLGDHFTLMVDKTKDVSKKEQISVVLRYLHSDDIHEEFLDFVPADGLDAQSLLMTVKQTLAKFNIDKNACIAQCYDGTSVMSGCNNGVQEKFRQEVPHAVYIHCHAHRLNLVLVDCVHNVKPVAECFATVQLLYNFFSGSVTHSTLRFGLLSKPFLPS